MFRSKKINGLLILFIIYIVAAVIGVFSFNFLLKYNMPILLNIFIADVIATIFIWIVGIFFNTASIYDPYWSIQTVVIYLLLMLSSGNVNFGTIIYLAVLLFWAIRLTWNFAHGFNDISYIDWRYAQIREKTGIFYQFVSLLGIHLVPTIVVYFASIPSFLYVIEGCEFHILDLIGLIVMLIGVTLEIISDMNMVTFKKERKSREEIINIGLWKYSRHPNYLGEIVFWYGVWMVLSISRLSFMHTILGAILNTALFLFISIPLAENHMKTYKPGFEDYKKKTRMLLPLKK